MYSENSYNHQLLTKNKHTGGKIRQKSINVPVCLLETLEYFKLHEINTTFECVMRLILRSDFENLGEIQLE